MATTLLVPLNESAFLTLPATPAVGQPLPAHEPLLAEPEASADRVLPAASSRCSRTMLPPLLGGGGGGAGCGVARSAADCAELLPPTAHAETVWLYVAR